MENNEEFNTRTDLTELNESVTQIQNEIKKIIVGQEKMIELLIVAIFCEGHVLLEGLPGVAKTLAAKCLAKTIDAGFSRLQFTPDLMPSDVVGTMVYNAKEGEFAFKRGPIFSNIILIDEINRSPAKTQAALFECMEEHQVTIDGVNYPLKEPFMVIGTQNPVDHEGTYMLPEAQLDRFMFKIDVPYPKVEEEIEILSRNHVKELKKGLDEVQNVLTADRIKNVRKLVRSITVKEELFRYIAEITQGTRNNPSLFLGASTRASLSLLIASKAMAAIQGRDFVVPEDIREVAFPVLNHRVTLTPEKEMEGMTIREVVNNIIQKVEVPR